jgi:hypothetical protein
MRITMTMARKMQLGTQKEDHNNGQEKITNNTRKGLQRWPRRCNHEHKRRIATITKKK